MTAILVVTVADSDSVPLDSSYCYLWTPLWLHCAFTPGCLHLLSSDDCPQATGTTLPIRMEGQICLELYVLLGWPLANDWWVREYENPAPLPGVPQNLRCSTYCRAPPRDQAEAGTFPNMEPLLGFLPRSPCFSHSLPALPREHFLKESLTPESSSQGLFPRNSALDSKCVKSSSFQSHIWRYNILSKCLSSICLVTSRDGQLPIT